MSLSLQERLLIPALLTGIVALLSFGFTFMVGGGTRRVRVVGLCAMIFTAGTMYCMFWHEQLTVLFGWQHAWIGASVLVALGSAYLCRTLLASRRKNIAPDIDQSSHSDQM
jgi:hypothetical protein